MTLAIWMLSFLFSTAPADPFLGTWLTQDKDARVEITRQGNVYTGRYVGFTDPVASRKKGYRMNDVVFKDLQQDDSELAGKVIDGTKVYNATLTLPDANHLLMKVKVMGVTAHSETWTRVVVAAPVKN